jgi:predicted O-linked N-acetylglucosamine transferase (SPINDLY family)
MNEITPSDDDLQRLMSLYQAGRYDEAEVLVMSILESFPGYQFCWKVLGTLYGLTNRQDKALIANRQAVVLEPKDSEAHYNLGNTFQELGVLEEAIESYSEAIALRFDYAEAHYNLGVQQQELGRLDEAEASYRQAIKNSPNLAVAHNNLGKTLAELGRLEEAINSFNKAIAIKPDYADAYSNKFMYLQYSSDYSRKLLFRYHLEFEEQFGGLGVRTFLSPPSMKLAREPLRVGYVSGDFKVHSVAYFFLSLLEQHDPNLIETFCYYNNTVKDKMTERLIAASDHWHFVHQLSNQDLVDVIKRDRIDILVDLSGHTGKNRLLVFAQKPAPIQITWLGYPDTTGLSAIDYRFTDSIADPVGVADSLHSEKLVRLPRGFLCYQGDTTALESKTLPKKKQGYITFGSFNNLLKVTPQVIKVWSKILHQVPDSKLLLKYNQIAYSAERYLKLFAQEGITGDRLKFYGKLPNFKHHLELYNSIDLCLDPFPYNGATTTCESLWMGVPVVTLSGDRHVSRVGASILTCVGLTDFIAKDIDDYIKIAVAKSANENDLESTKKGLREKMQSSQLCDAKLFASEVEHAYRDMWQYYLDTCVT